MIAAGVLIASHILAQQASPPGDERPAARILLKIATRYSISNDFRKSLKGVRWGFIDGQGKAVVEPRFEEAGDPADGVTPVQENGKWGWFDQKGAYIDAQLSGPVEFREGLASFKREGKAGFIDAAGKIAIEPQWDAAHNFNEGLASVTQNGKDGFIDKTGKIVITPRWEQAGEFHDALAGVKEKGKWGYIDRTGKIVIKAEWDDSTTFSDGFAVVFRGGKGGVIDKQGKVVVPVESETIMPCSVFVDPLLQYDGVPESTRQKNEKSVCLDKGGKILVDPTFEKLGGFSHRLDPMNEGDKWGLMDGTKRFVIEPQWEIIIPHEIAKDQVYWLVAREDKNANGKSVLVEWRDPKGKKIWSSVESATR